MSRVLFVAGVLLSDCVRADRYSEVLMLVSSVGPDGAAKLLGTSLHSVLALEV